MHGANDAQKTMGIITGALVTGGFLDEVRGAVLGRVAVVHGDRPRHAAAAAGASSRRWARRSRSSAGRRLRGRDGRGGGDLHGDAMGVGISTTHTITGAIVGVGATRRLSAVRWGVAGQIVWAWILTIPASAALGAVVLPRSRDCSARSDACVTATRSRSRASTSATPVSASSDRENTPREQHRAQADRSASAQEM